MSYFSFLGVSFLICETGMIIVTPPVGWLEVPGRHVAVDSAERQRYTNSSLDREPGRSPSFLTTQGPANSLSFPKTLAHPPPPLPGPPSPLPCACVLIAFSPPPTPPALTFLRSSLPSRLKADCTSHHVGWF